MRHTHVLWFSCPAFIRQSSLLPMILACSAAHAIPDAFGLPPCNVTCGSPPSLSRTRLASRAAFLLGEGCSPFLISSPLIPNNSASCSSSSADNLHSALMCGSLERYLSIIVLLGYVLRICAPKKDRREERDMYISICVSTDRYGEKCWDRM